MSSASPTIVFLSAEDLDQLRVCIKSRTLKEKLSALKNPHGATLMTASLNPMQRLLSMFEGNAKEKLSLYLKDPTQSVNFNDIKSVPLKRGQRREVHNLIRQVSKDKLDSDLDNETSRINIFVRSTAPQPYKQNQGPRFPHKQNTQQQRAPVRTTPYRNTNNRNNASRPKLATRGVTAPRTSTSAPLTVEQLAKKFAPSKQAAQPATQQEAAQPSTQNDTAQSTAQNDAAQPTAQDTAIQPTAQNEALVMEAQTEARDTSASGVKTHELHNARVVETFKLRLPKNKVPDLSAEETAEREERRKNFDAPHLRGAATQDNADE